MEISASPSIAKPSATNTATVDPTAKDDAKTEKTENIREYIKSSTNTAILSASLDVSISTGDKSMQLLYKTAIDNINQILKPEFGDNAIQAKASEDQSPDATAGRIVSLSTAFFDKFMEQRPGMDKATAAQQFRDVLSKGIDQGFSEARNILNGLNVLSGDIASNVDKTYELVQNKLNDFFAQFTTPATEAAPVPEPATS
jgi:hypothetical protein